MLDIEKSNEELLAEFEELKTAYQKDNAERNLIEDALRESEVRLAAITNSAQDAIIMMDHEGLISYWNPAAEELLGYTHSEATKKNLHDLIVPKRFHQAHHVAFPEFQKTGKGAAIGKTMEVSALTKSGQEIDVELSLSSVKINEKWHAVGIIREITERKQSEWALRERMKELEAFYRLSEIASRKDITLDSIYLEVANMLPKSMLYPDIACARIIIDNQEFKSDNFEDKEWRLTKEISLFGKTSGIIEIIYVVEMPDIYEGPFLKEEIQLLDSVAERLGHITERNRTEEAFRRSEMKFHTLYDSTSDAVMLLDSKGFFDCNSATLKIFGVLSKEEFCSMHPGELSPVLQPSGIDSMSLSTQQIEIAMEKGANKFEWMHKRFDTGENFPAEVLLSAMELDGKQVLQAVVRDITERKQTESFQHFSTEILEILNEPIPFSDSINRILNIFKEGMNFDAVGIRMASGDDFPYLTQIGFSNDFLLTENTLIVRDKVGQPCRNKDGNLSLECTCGLVITGAAGLDSPFFTKAGSFWTNNSMPLLDIPLNEDPRLHPRNNCIHKGYMSVALVPIKVQNKIVGLLQLNAKKEDRFTLEMIHFLEGVCTNIGGALWRKQLDDNLRQSEDRYRKAQEVAHVGSWEFDVKKRKLWGSDETKRIFGFDNINDDFDKEVIMNCVIESERVDKALVDLIDKSIPYNIEYEILPLNSSEKRIIHSVAEIAKDEADDTVRINGVIRDITEVKQKEAEITKANEDLRDSNEIIETNLFQKNVLIEELSETKDSLEKTNAEKDKFFSIIAHDLKSPFSGFLGLTKIMVEDFQDLSMKEMESFSQSMMESANNLYKLLENLLEWSRMQRGVTEFNPEICYLNFIINQNVEIQTEVAKQKGIELINNVPDDANVMADIPMLNTVIRNLMSNAIKFTPRGGRIEIGDSSDGLHSDGDQLATCIYIKDSGIGMSADTIEKLFKIDQKVSRPGTEGEPSSGLGLLLCKEFVERQGGRIWVESEEGKGSTFYFTLPKDVQPLQG